MLRSTRFPPALPFVLLAFACFLHFSIAASFAPVTLGYTYFCLPNTLEYPCVVITAGIAVIDTNVQYANIGPFRNVPYNSLLSFTGTRSFYNKYGEWLNTSATLLPVGTIGSYNELCLTQPYICRTAYQLSATVLEVGGVPGDRIIMGPNGPYSASIGQYAIEIITVNTDSGNAANFDPSLTRFCSNATGLIPYSSSPPYIVASAFADISACSNPPLPEPLPFELPIEGTRELVLSYEVVAPGAYATSAIMTLVTDGSVNVDQLGNIYYIAIAATGNYSQTNLYTGEQWLSNITGVLPLCTIRTSNEPYICNWNRVYTTFPYVDRLGLGFQLSSLVPIDGMTIASIDQQSVFTYRGTSLEEAVCSSFPPFFNDGALISLETVASPADSSSSSSASFASSSSSSASSLPSFSSSSSSFSDSSASSSSSSLSSLPSIPSSSSSSSSFSFSSSSSPSTSSSSSFTFSSSSSSFSAVPPPPSASSSSTGDASSVLDE